MASRVQSTMMAGARGELLKEVNLVSETRTKETPIIIGIYAGATIVSAVLSTIVMSAGATLFLDILLFAVWGLIGYFFIAVGTRFSHGMATWGVALIAAILALSKALGNLSGALMWNTMSTMFDSTDVDIPGSGGYVFRMVLFGAISAACFYLVVEMSRAMKVMTPQGLNQPGFTPPHAQPNPENH